MVTNCGRVLPNVRAQSQSAFLRNCVCFPLDLRWLASFELKLIFFRNTFCHHRSPFAEHKSVIFYRDHHSN